MLYGFGKIDNLLESMIAVKTTPHSWLFPSIIVLFSNDQFTWAYRAYDLGIGVRPIPKKELSSEKLLVAITPVFNEEIIAKAQEVSGKIRLETGLQDAVDVILCSMNYN